MTLSAETQERIQVLIRTYVDRIEELRLWEDISSGWQRRIRRALKIPSDDTPWAVCDSTFLHSGRIGFALTPWGIYWRTPWYAPVSEHGFLPWQDFVTLSPEAFQIHPENKSQLSLGEQAFIYCDSPTSLSWVHKLFQEMWQTLQGQKFTPKEADVAVPREAPTDAAPPPDAQIQPSAPGGMPWPVRCAYCGHIWPAWEPACPACGAPLPLPEARQRQMEKKLHQVVLQYLPKIERLKLWQALNPHKQATARKAFRLSKEDNPWALYDTTLLSSAKRGFVLTPSGIYWSNPWYVSPTGTGFLSWEHAFQVWRYFPPSVTEEEPFVQLSSKIAIETLSESDAAAIVEMFRALFSVLSQYL